MPLILSMNHMEANREFCIRKYNDRRRSHFKEQLNVRHMARSHKKTQFLHRNQSRGNRTLTHEISQINRFDSPVLKPMAKRKVQIKNDYPSSSIPLKQCISSIRIVESHSWGYFVDI